MQINLARPLIRMASVIARRYHDQMRRENEATLRQQFAALDYGLVPATTPDWGRGLPVTTTPNRNDPLEQLWHLPARNEASVRPHNQTTGRPARD